jgi:hypothetical protein
MKRDQLRYVKIGNEYSWMDSNKLPVDLYIDKALILKHIVEQVLSKFQKKLKKEARCLEIDQIGSQPENPLTPCIVIIP